MASAVTQLGYDRLIDVVGQYSSMDANGVYLEIAQVLHRALPILDILPMVPSNQIISHIGSRESYLPSPSSRRFNEYVSPSAARTTPLTEGIAMFEDYSEVDAALCAIQNDPTRWRMDRDKLKVEGFRQKIETGIIYGCTAADGNDILGLAGRFKNTATRPNGDSTWAYNVWDGGGTGSDLTSIWMMELGLNKAYATFPKNLPAGLNIRNLGEQTAQTSAGLMQVLRTHFQWFFGLFIEDERCIQRYANIETAGSSNIFDESILIQMKNRLPNRGEAPGTVILMNRTCLTQVEVRANDKSNAFYVPDASGSVFGRPVMRFQGLIPIICADMILDTETQVTNAT